MHTITAQSRQFLRIIGFTVVCHYKISERHLLIDHRVEKRAQLFRTIIAGESPYQFLVFHIPQFGVMRFIRDIGNNPVHKNSYGSWNNQFTAIDFGLDVPVRMKVAKNTFFTPTDRIIEFMYQDRNITQGYTITLTLAGNKHNFSRTKYFIIEKATQYSSMSTLTIIEIIDV